jgi:signal transduction histidine kinase
MDAGRIRRALANLAINAAQAGARTVKICLQRSPSALTVWVEDDGNGIPEELRPRLFQAFATFGKKGGTGLGLASAKRVIEAHHGTIELVSSTKGSTVFQIWLPAEPSVLL